MGERVSTFTCQARIIIICPRARWKSARWSWISAGVEIRLLLNSISSRPRPHPNRAAAPYQAFSELVVSSDPNSSKRQALCSPPCPAPSLQMGKVRPRGAGQQSQTRNQDRNPGLTGLLSPVPAELQGGTLTAAAAGKTLVFRPHPASSLQREVSAATMRGHSRAYSRQQAGR